MSQWLLHGQEIDISLDRQHRHQYNYECALPKPNTAKKQKKMTI